MNGHHETSEPSREAIRSLKGAVLVEFGTSWCGYCRMAQPLIASALADHPGVRHIRISDGKGYPMGRSFQVVLWPTLVFLRDGEVVETLVRPHEVWPIRDALEKIERV